MKRKSMKDPALKDWAEVDDALRRIGELDIQLEGIEHSLNRRITEAREYAGAQAEPLLDKKKALELSVKEFTESRRAEFRKRKSKRLRFGEVSFRRSTSVVIRNVKKCLALLQEKGLTGCIRNNPKPDKDAMRKLTDSQLKEVGASRKVEDVFGYTVDREPIEKGGL